MGINEAQACCHCGKEASSTCLIRLCTGCRSIRYCSRECQAVSWPSHKQDCKTLQKEAAEIKKMKEWNPKLTGLSRIETKVAYDKWMKRNKAIIDSMVLHALLRPKEKLDMVDTHGMLLVLVHNLEATTPENFFLRH
ncbi:hypothetical protein FRB95_002159 [Tulasnella sp. JGI-2019a]|nr:hypothetical protein FRB95_002159 [Tulasnella sp. JGI-2019a]